MYPNAALENVFGTIGAVLWSIQIIPQIIKSYREKSTAGLSPALMWIWTLAGLFLGVYTIVQKLGIALQVQPQAFALFATASWAQCLYYGGKRSFRRVFTYFCLQLVVFAGVQVALVFALRAGVDNGTTAPITACGIVTAVLLAGGLIPQYIEIYQLKQVIGISLFFMLVDMAGGVFSVISLVFRDSLDILAVISYSGVVVLDGIVILLAYILNPRMARKTLAEKEAAALQAHETAGVEDAPMPTAHPTSVQEKRALETAPV